MSRALLQSTGMDRPSLTYGPRPRRYPLAGVGQPLSMFLAVIGILAAVAAFLRLTELYLLLNLQTVARGDLVASDRRLQGIETISLLTMAPTVVLFLRWFHRAYGNIHPTARRWGTKWAIGGWFAPVASFVVPFQIAQDIWRWSETHPAPGASSRRPVSWSVNGWWLLWVVSGTASWGGLIFRQGGTVGTLQISSLVLLVSELALAGCAALAWTFVTHVTRLQDGGSNGSDGTSIS